MDGIPGPGGIMATADLVAIMNKTAAGFASAQNGAGMTMYWVVDNGATPAQDFATPLELGGYIRNNNLRNARLKDEFVHLQFAKNIVNEPNTGGSSSTYGSFILVESWNKFATDNGFNLIDGLAHVTAHELTHLIMRGATPEAEHTRDGNENTVVDEPADRAFLMYPFGNAMNWTTIVFEDVTRRQITLVAKNRSKRQQSSGPKSYVHVAPIPPLSTVSRAIRRIRAIVAIGVERMFHRESGLSSASQRRSSGGRGAHHGH